MNLLDMILNAQNGGQVDSMARNLGISSDEAKKALGAMIPSLSRGIQNNVKKGNGLNELMEALSRGNHQRYMNEPDVFEKEDTLSDGNNILEHILGSRDISRNVAGAASNKTGLSTEILKKMLPMIAAMAMGALSKQSSEGGNVLGKAMGGGQSAPDIGGLAAFLDADKDGEVIDDLLNLGKRFF